MAGENRAEELIGYLSRLTGEPLSAGDTVRLRSVHRAALASWARKNGITLRASVMGSGQPFTASDLLNDQQEQQEAPPVSNNPHLMQGVAATGVGIDIEDVDSMPQAEDYREHSFYTDNFTPAEIAYCLRQRDVRATLCGMWAAKEAIVKAGFARAEFGHLSSIVITHDAHGRPVASQCQISISHTARTAIAVCLAHTGLPAAPRVTAEEPVPASSQKVAGNTRQWRMPVAAVIALVLVSAATFGWHAWANLN